MPYLGRRYEYTQLASHPAVIVVPYTKSTMTFFELYRIGIPIFVPSLALLVRAARPRWALPSACTCPRRRSPPPPPAQVRWELQRHVMSERVYWKHTPSPLSVPSTPDPNALQDRAALEHWLRLSDYYVYPHVQARDDRMTIDEHGLPMTTTDCHDPQKSTDDQ